MGEPSCDFGMRGHIAGFLCGDLSAIDFQRWFASAADDIEASGDHESFALALDVENLLAEYTGDHIDESELTAALRQMVGDAPPFLLDADWLQSIFDRGCAMLAPITYRPRRTLIVGANTVVRAHRRGA